MKGDAVAVLSAVGWRRTSCPSCVGVAVAIFYFMAVMPGARQHLGKYLLTALVLFLLSRIPNAGTARRCSSPRSSATGGESGRARSSPRPNWRLLQGLHGPRSARARSWPSSVWVGVRRPLRHRAVLLDPGVLDERGGRPLHGPDLRLPGAVLRLLPPQAPHGAPRRGGRRPSWTSCPTCPRCRVTFFFKAGISVMAMTALAFTAYGVLVYARLTRLPRRLRPPRRAPAAPRRWPSSSPDDPDALEGSPGREGQPPVHPGGGPDGTGTAQPRGSPSGPFEKAVLRDVIKPRPRRSRRAPTCIVLRQRGRALPHQQGPGPRPHGQPRVGRRADEADDRLRPPLPRAHVSVRASTCSWLSQDTARTLARAVEFNQRLAAGDLTRTPAIWCDDEIGVLTDNLRIAFQGLQRMTREVVQRLHLGGRGGDPHGGRDRVHPPGGHRPTASADRTTESLKTMEEGMQRVSQAMEQVATRHAGGLLDHPRDAGQRGGDRAQLRRAHPVGGEDRQFLERDLGRARRP